VGKLFVTEVPEEGKEHHRFQKHAVRGSSCKGRSEGQKDLTESKTAASGAMKNKAGQARVKNYWQEAEKVVVQNF